MSAVPTRVESTAAPLLEVRDLHVAYGKVEAVHGVGLRGHAGGEGGEDVELGGEGTAQGGERDAGAPGDLGQADLLERLLGGERQQRAGGLLAGLFGRPFALPWLVPAPQRISA